jgi:hypothetical protein
MHFLLRIPTILALLLAAAVTTTLALTGLFFVRRKYRAEELRENHEVAAIIFGAFGWLYAVIVAFVVFVTWTGYDEANKNMQLEASQALDIFDGSEAFAEPLRSTIRQQIAEYLQSVADEELPGMATENMSLHSLSALVRLNSFFNVVTPDAVRNRELYGALLQRLDDLMQYRRLRIFAGRNSVPSLIWVVLLVGGVITITNTYFFGMKNVSAQALMTAALTVMLTLVLFLIFTLDHPFTGVNRVPDAPLREALALMKQKSAPPSANR